MNLQYWLQTARRMFRNRGISAIVVLALALGIGANTTIFSLVDAIFFQYLPVSQPNRIIGIYVTVGSRVLDDEFPMEDYQYYKERNTVFQELVAHYSTAPLYLMTPDGESQPLKGSVVSSNYFTALRLTPSFGRFFRPEEDNIGTQYPVAVLSHDLWVRKFGGDRRIIGSIIHLNTVSFTIVGVAPPEFHGVYGGIANDIWIPLSMSSIGYRWCDTRDRSCAFLSMIGRLKDGRKLEEAKAEMSTLVQQVKLAHPSADNDKWGVMLDRVRGVRPSSRQQFTIVVNLLIVAGIALLLIAAANLSALMLVQGIARSKEIAIKLSLGASRLHIVGQLLSEAFLLSMVGGAGGLLLARLAAYPLAKLIFVVDDGRPAVNLGINNHILIFVFVATIAMIFLFALSPALINTQPQLVRVLKDQDSLGGFKKSWLRRSLVAVQIGLSVLLLTGTALLMKSLNSILHDRGFDPHRLVTMRISPVRLGYTPAKAEAFQREVLRRVEAMPETESASLMEALPWWPGRRSLVSLPGQAAAPNSAKLSAWGNRVTPGYFKTAQIKQFAGRDFAESDRRDSSNVVIVNDILADRLWPGGDAVGRAMLIGPQPYTVIGIVKDLQYRNVSDPPRAGFYLPYWQAGDPTDAHLCVQTRTDGNSALVLVHRTVAAVDPDVPISQEMTMVEGLQRSFGSVFLARDVVFTIGIVALFLSMIGLYGVIAFTVVQRTREIGIRLALGATRSNILRFVVREGLLLAVSGITLGIFGTVSLVKFISSLLYGVAPFDLASFVIVSAFLVLLAIIASYFPARRAAKISPLTALRTE